MEKKRMVAAERDALMELALITDFAENVREVMVTRSKDVKRARTVLGLLTWAAGWLLGQYLDTLPDAQLVSFARNLRDRSVRFGAKSARKDHYDEFGVWMSFDDLGALAEAARDHCLTCDLCDGRERKCALRIALDNLGTELEHDDNGTGCAYRWM